MKDASSSTMLMLRGIPVEYTPQGVLEVLSASYGGKFDLLYLPTVDGKPHYNPPHGDKSEGKMEQYKSSTL